MAIKKKKIQILGEIENIDIKDDLEQSFIDYAMSVITDRAIPNVEDGLKISQRRTLYTMYTLGLSYNKNKFAKVSRISGETIGLRHPHAPAAIEECLARLMKPWIVNYPLAIAQGSVGTPDYSAEVAAPRYLESRLSQYGDLLLSLIEKDTVNFIPNYDETDKEPVLLPSLYPNILTNGSMGIAVGVASSIPSNNLIESCNGVIAYLKNNNISIEDLVKIIPGPDLPLGGTIINSDDMLECYRSGKGKAIIRGNPIIEKNIIIFKEIPYGVGTNVIVSKIMDLMIEGNFPEIEDVFDNTRYNAVSEQIEVEISIYLKKDINVNIDSLLNRLYATTPLQSNISFNMVVLVGKTPKLCGLKDIIKYYSEHLCSVHRRSLEFDLNKIKNKLHLLEGFKIALAHIDEVVEIIKTSANKQDCILKLKALLLVDDIQCEAILDLKLSRLTKLEVNKIEEDINECKQRIFELENTLNNLIDYVINQLNEVKKYGSPRRTKLDNIEIKKSKGKPEIIEQEVILSLDKKTNIIKQIKKGNGIKCLNTDDLLIFTKQGRIHKILINDIITNYDTNYLNDGDDISEVFVMDYEEKLFMFITNKGLIKLSKSDEYSNVSKRGTSALKLKPLDSVQRIEIINKDVEKVILTTSLNDKIELTKKDLPVASKNSFGKDIIEFEENEVVVSISY